MIIGTQACCHTPTKVLRIEYRARTVSVTTIPHSQRFSDVIAYPF